VNINAQLAAQAGGNEIVDPSKPRFAISPELRGHIENDFGDTVTGSEVYPAPDWSIAPGAQGVYVYSRATNETHRLPFELPGA
jgi:hypothetical protein